MSGNYPIERRDGEIDRLRVQARAMAFDAGVMLDRIGIQPGWHCLDLGCGPGGIIDLLSARVGPSGSVTGLDTDPAMVAAARDWADGLQLTNVEIVQGDAYDSGLPRAAFDLVHIRFLASTAGMVDKLLTEALALTKPGGLLAFEEPDLDTLNCFPQNSAWERLKSALEGVWAAVGGDIHLAQRLYRLLRHAGLEDVQYRPFLIGVTSDDPMVDYLPQTIESLRKALLENELMEESELDAAIEACRHHLADPETVFTSYLVAQVWGCKSGTSARATAVPSPGA